MNNKEAGAMQMNLTRQWAATAHEGQFRADGKTPYVTHPWRVGDTLSMMGEPVEVVMAGYLHDVPEDTPYGLEDIERTFGRKVAALVEWLTNTTHGMKASRAERKRIDRERLANAPREAKLIKLVDRIDNLQDTGKDEGFLKLYREESQLLLEVLRGTHKGLEAELEALAKEKA